MKSAVNSDKEKLKNQLNKNALSFLNRPKDETSSPIQNQTVLKDNKNNSLKSLMNPGFDKKINLISRLVKTAENNNKLMIISTKKNQNESIILEKLNVFTSKNRNKIIPNEININIKNNIDTNNQGNQVKKALFKTNISIPKSPINSIYKSKRMGTVINKNFEEIQSSTQTSTANQKIIKAVKPKQSQPISSKIDRSSSLALIDKLHNFKEVILFNVIINTRNDFRHHKHLN